MESHVQHENIPYMRDGNGLTMPKNILLTIPNNKQNWQMTSIFIDGNLILLLRVKAH